jgi:AbrB family looped-hinge helix DNA binding protein
MTDKLDTVSFTTKGQVVIPLRLRKQFDIEDGTKAVVQATPDGILLKPMTAALIKRGRGILKRKPGGRPLTQHRADHPTKDLADDPADGPTKDPNKDWAEHKKQERALEERHAR